MNIVNIRASISVTITDIWTKLGTEHNYHSINIAVGAYVPNSLSFEIQDGGGRCIRSRKISITSKWIELYAPNLVGRCVTAIGGDTRPIVETGCLFARRHQINVGNIIASILWPRRALNLQVFSFGLCSNHRFAVV